MRCVKTARVRLATLGFVQLLLDVLKWTGFVAVGFAVAGIVLVGILAWLLNLPIDDDAGRSAGRC